MKRFVFANFQVYKYRIRYDINETRICIKCIFYTFILCVLYYHKTNTRIFDFVKSFFEIGDIIFKILTSKHVYSLQKYIIKYIKLSHLLFFSQILYLSTF